jgi:hypothetical protein
MNHAPLRLALAVALLAFSGAALAQRIATNAHQPVLAGDAIDLSLLDLKPGQTVSLSATRVVRMFTGQVSLFAAEAKFTADAMGRVDLATQAPLPNSSYEGADVRGLLCSMKPVAGETQGKTFNELAFTLRGDDGKALAEAVAGSGGLSASANPESQGIGHVRANAAARRLMVEFLAG